MKLLSIFYLSLVAVGFLTGMLGWKKSDKTIRPIIIYLGVVFVSEIISFLLAKIYRNNMPAFHIFSPIHFLLISIFFYNNIFDEGLKKFIKWGTIAFILFSIINTVFIQNIKTLPENFNTPVRFFIIFWAAYLFFQLLESPVNENIFKNPVFIITVAILWFNIISFLFYLLYGFAKTYKLGTTTIDIIHFFSNYILYFLLFLAMIFSKIQQKHARKF